MSPNETPADVFPEVLDDETDRLGANHERETSTRELDAETLFSADVSATRVLTRAEEVELSQRIARQRRRVRAILRRARRLARAALAEQPRGVVSPDEDFREREVLAILTYAQRALQDARLARAIGYGRRKLRALVAELSAALADYRVLRDQMVRANVRLVNLVARRYRHPTVSFLDLVQEGTIGLLRAVEKYDPTRDIKFSTYATWWIWQQVSRAADTQAALVRTPVHWTQLRRRVSREAHTACPGAGPACVARGSGSGTRHGPRPLGYHGASLPVRIN